MSKDKIIFPGGGDYANDSKVAGQYISRSSVAGYVGGSHAKEDKFYSTECSLPCITRYGVQIHDTRIAPNHVRFASLSELVRASTLSPGLLRVWTFILDPRLL